ncbi:MAG TPA: HAD hydrolase family protein [Candidatus Limnocylindrales bacterium]|nr:HAD hydrolase family protein [Candidatus Limnocylindrales bacterium]
MSVPGASTTTPAFPIRLVALDLDGTLVDDGLELRERTIAAVGAAVSRGVSVSIVTGRMTTSALRFARRLGLVDPMVGYQGAIIRSMPTADDGRLGRLLLHRPLEAAATREAIRYSRSIGLSPHVNHLEKFIIGADDPRIDDYSAWFGGRAVLVQDLAAAIRRPVSKVISVGEEPIPHDVLDTARACFDGRAEVTVSHPRFLEFLRPGVSKGVAVAWLARRARVPLANTLAIGDQFNDVEMITAVGHGAAMPHAPAPVRAIARYIAPPLHEEGAAQLIEQLVLADPRSAAEASARLAAEADAARDEAAVGHGARHVTSLPATA